MTSAQALSRAIVVLSIVTSPVVAHAQGPVLQVTGCELVSSPGADNARITFEARNGFDHSIASISMEFLESAPAVGCQIFEAVASGGWTGTLTPEGGVLWESTPGNSIPPDGVVPGFQIVAELGSCCFLLRFVGTDPLDPLVLRKTCLDCSSETPVRPCAWGEMKSRYR